ncbi:MAG: insulinase family protein [Deltaproteobacteria bacterium]|nr:insulinase family protein [Deltaproteobacteria bacterium]
MRSRIASFAATCVMVLLAQISGAQPAPGGAAKAIKEKTEKPAAPSLRPKLAIERFTLDNGLRVVLNPDPTSPTLAVVVWYDVGSRDEKPGEGGFAHLFEHMMFEGSAGVPRGEHDKIVEGRGGKLNASTSEDWTRYFETMPSSELAVTLYLEADRMKSLQVTEEAFENQRKVVQEEYRMRVENAPFVKGYFRLMELVYEGYHPYAHPVIGSMDELDAAKLAWVQSFHKRWYGPNNAVLVIAGDVDVAQAKALVTKYFAGVARIPLQPTTFPAYAGRTKPSGPEALTDPNARTPATMLAWSIPPDHTKEHYALEMAAAVLSDGESSRLHRKLVKDLAIAQNVSVSTEDHRGPDAFVVDAQLAEKGKVDDVEKAIWAEIDDLAKKGPTAAELQKARAKVEHAFLFGLQANLSRAMALAKFEGHHGDATLLTGEPDKYLAVTADDVRAAVAKYLVREKLAHVRVLPKDQPEKAPKPAPAKPAKPAPGKPVKKEGK